MATPFKVFRDNQKVLMVVFGALLMVAFIILPPVLQYGFDSQQVREEEGPVVVSIGDEELREEEVQQLVRKYTLVATVLYEGMTRAAQLRAQPEPPFPMIPGFDYQQPSRMNPQGGLYVKKIEPYEAVEYYAWGKKADEMGLVVDDQSVNDFLSRTAGGKLNGYDYDAILSEVIPQQERTIITYDYFFEQVRDVLKAQKMLALMQRNARVVTPTAAWVWYRNLNRTISAEMFPISADDYLDKVGKPTDAQVEELFEKYRYQSRNPQNDQLGFRPQDKIALAYIKADFNAFLDNAKSQITDEQVAQYYEENKESFTKPDLPSAGPEMPAGGEETAPMETTEPSAETPSTETMPPAEGEQPMESTPAKPAEEKPAAEPMTEPMPEAKPMEEAKPETPAEPEKPAEPEAKSEEPKGEEPKTEEPKTEEAKPEDSSRNDVSPGVQLVSYLQEEGSEQPAEPMEPAQPMEEAAPMAEESQPMTEAQPMEEVVVEEEAVVVEEPMTDNPMEEAPVSYRSLAEVQDEIRTTLARPVAQAAMDEALAEMTAELQSQYADYLYQKESEEKSTSPFDSDAIQQMATKLGLSFGALPLMDEIDAMKTELGETARITEFVTQPQFQQVNRSLVREAFGSSASLYQPRLFPGPTSGSVIRQSASTQYVYWKTEEKEGYDPTLEDVRAEVVKTWKQLEAQKLAKAAAEKIAQGITDKESLAKAATEHLQTVIVADNITYLNQLGGPQSVTLGEIPGIPPTELSQETMDALFSTPVGQSTVAPSRTENNYYVSLVTGETETMEELRENFAKQVEGAPPNSVMTYALGEDQIVNQAMMVDFLDPTFIKWKIDPTELSSGV